MKLAESVRSRQKFDCPAGCGCPPQRVLSMFRHLRLFHKWSHVAMDEWIWRMAGVTIQKHPKRRRA